MLMLPATIALRWRRSGRILSYTLHHKFPHETFFPRIFVVKDIGYYSFSP